jgi:hypothetical protein
MALTERFSPYVTATGSVTSITVTLTSTPTSGDLLIAGIAIRNTDVLSLPSGWTELHTEQTDDLSMQWCYKSSNGAESSVAWSWTTSGNVTAFCVNYQDGYTLDQIPTSNNSNFTGSPFGTNTTGTQSASNNSALAFFASFSGDTTTPGLAFTNSYVEQLSPGAGSIARTYLALLDLSGTAATDTDMSWSSGSTDVMAAIATFTPDAGPSPILIPVDPAGTPY